MSTTGIEESALPVAAILAVDDHPANLLAISAILEPLGCDLRTSQSGQKALELARGSEFAVILLDVMMPEMDGFETLARLRSLPEIRQVPVILVTAYELDARAMDSVWRMGPVDYILKPIAPELLRSKIAAYVSLQRRGKALRLQGEALAAKDRDIAMLAHDLQNPLTGIGMAASILLRAELNPRDRQAAERISRGVGRMSEMIDNLTDYARAGRGPIPIAPNPMDLGQLCSELVDEFQNMQAGRRIDLGCGGHLRGEWDRNRLHQAISNLLGNAIRHGAGEVVVRAQGNESGVEVAVHNSGPPIGAELLPTIFEAFERGGESRVGLGLGLYIVREIAKAHGGDVSVSSSAEQGTTFVLRLPHGR